MTRLRDGDAKVGRGTTAVLAVVLLAMPVLSVYFYSGVSSRVAALRGSAEMLRETLSNPNDPRASVEYWVHQGLNASRQLNSELQFAQTYQDVDVERAKFYTQYLQGNVFQCKYFSDLAQKLTLDLVEEEQLAMEKGLEAKGTSFEPMLPITAELTNTTQQLDATFVQLLNAIEAAKSGGEAEMDTLRTKGIELTSHYYQAKAQIAAAVTTLAAGEANILAPFMLVTVLYVVFLLFPWILMALFFLRKREYQVETKIKLFTDLGLRISETSEKTEQKVIKEKEIREKAFRDREYFVSLTLLTIITGIMFYFFFYPYASAGLARLISSGGGVRAFADYLVTDATPLTFGFIGAYFYVINMLLRRYFAADLNPNPYTYAVVRMLGVFLLSAVLQLAASWISETQFVVSVVAFVVGIFPEVGVQWILRTVNKVVTTLRAPEYIDQYPLTKIDGLNIWHQARLLEEKVENVQNLATSSLHDLIIHTNFASSQLVDWVDQALLFIHTQELWNDAFHSVGIRTATDLLDNTRNKMSQFDPAIAERLAGAINAAQALGSVRNDQPRDSARLAAAELYKAVVDAARRAEEANNLAKTLDESKVATLDVIEELKEKVNSLETLVERDETVKNTKQAAKQLPADGGDLVKRGKEAVSNVEKSAKQLSEAVAKAKEVAGDLDRKKLEKLDKLADAKKCAESICVAAADFKAQVVSTITIAQVGESGANVKGAWSALLAALQKTREASEQILKEAKRIREIAAPLSKDQPNTLNRVLALQTHLGELQKSCDSAKTKMQKAKDACEGLLAARHLLVEAQASLDTASKATEKFVKLASDTKDAAGPLDIDSESTLVGLSEVKKSIEKLGAAAEEARTSGQKAAGALETASAPPAMTKDILEAMVKTIEKGPNIDYILNFWHRSIDLIQQ